ncbi:MAG TPA: hypothetical protein VFW23_11380 [Tepidisphaeraceae bacterium]|nr:hypothetical protein [Tepidisphaeraceae bacterium]
MKNLIILVLLVGLVAALFMTRPQQADFEKFAHSRNLTDPQPTASQTLVQSIEQKAQAYVGTNISFTSPTDSLLKKCTYQNDGLFTNVQENGQTIYTGIAGHWFQRGLGAAATPTSK